MYELSTILNNGEWISEVYDFYIEIQNCVVQKNMI